MYPAQPLVILSAVFNYPTTARGGPTGVAMFGHPPVQSLLKSECLKTYQGNTGLLYKLKLVIFQAVIMAQSAAKAAKVSSNARFESSWDISAGETATAKSRSIIATDVNTAGSRNAWPWACAVIVSCDLLRLFCLHFFLPMNPSLPRQP